MSTSARSRGCTTVFKSRLPAISGTAEQTTLGGGSLLIARNVVIGSAAGSCSRTFPPMSVRLLENHAARPPSSLTGNRGNGGSACWPAGRLLRRAASCQVAEHFWDPVGHAIVAYGYLFDRLIQALQREV